MERAPPLTPDKRYIVVRGRLWRAARPDLDPALRARLTRDLMAARRAVRVAREDAGALLAAREAVQRAKEGLGERGPPWWTDGAPDYNRHMARNTPYAGWFASLEAR